LHWSSFSHFRFEPVVVIFELVVIIGYVLSNEEDNGVGGVAWHGYDVIIAVIRVPEGSLNNGKC
jgi:hypothetical protein